MTREVVGIDSGVSYGGRGARRRVGRVLLALAAAAAPGVPGCSGILDSGDYLTVEVAEGRVPCAGVGPTECLLVRRAGQDGFEAYHGEIAGFQLEPGYRYRLVVSRHGVADRPTDGSSEEWRLVRVESKQRSPRWAELGHMREQASRWRSSRPGEYSLVVRLLCYCDPGVLGPVRLEVRTEGPAFVEEATARLYTDDGAPVPVELWQFYPTVDGLFGVIVQAAAHDAHVLQVEYDAAYGYPSRIYVDPRQHVTDDEVEYRVLEMAPR